MTKLAFNALSIFLLLPSLFPVLVMSFKTLVVNSSTGVELSYIDSGPPKQKDYTTIIAIHGLSFTNGKRFLFFRKI